MNEFKKNKYKNDDINTLEYIKKRVDRILKDKDYCIISLVGIYFFTLSSHNSNTIRINIILMDIIKHWIDVRNQEMNRCLKK